MSSKNQQKFTFLFEIFVNKLSLWAIISRCVAIFNSRCSCLCSCSAIPTDNLYLVPLPSAQHAKWRGENCKRRAESSQRRGPYVKGGNGKAGKWERRGKLVGRTVWNAIKSHRHAISGMGRPGRIKDSAGTTSTTTRTHHSRPYPFAEGGKGGKP